MSRSMRRLLSFLSLALVLAVWTAGADDGRSAERQRFAFTLDSPRGGLSGVMALSVGSDVIKGAMVNEFGFSAVDFIYSRDKHKVKLVNVIDFLDNWRVRYAMRRDLTAIVTVLEGIDRPVGKNYDVSYRGDTVRIVSRRYGLTYMFSPLDGSLPRYAPAVNIWDGTDCDATVRMTPYLAPGDGNMAVIVCPGGSYFWHDRKTEGMDVARWLQSVGISAFVLEYRVGGIESFITHSRLVRRGNRYPDMLCDILRAIELVRCDSDSYGTDPSRVGVMGFSAGGHLAVLAGERFDKSIGAGGSDISLRPDFIVSVYPVVTFMQDCMHRRSRRGIMGEGRGVTSLLADTLSLERHVRPDMPPVFLMNCRDDRTVNYRNSELLDSALSHVGVQHRYLQYETGGHGFGVTASKTSSEAAQWPGELLKWLSDMGLLSNYSKTSGSDEQDRD